MGRYDKGLPGHKTFVDLYSAAPSETPHYRITNLGFEYNTAIDDRYGKGQEANAIESMGGVISKSKENYLETMEHKHLFGNRQQAIEDTKVFQSTFKEIPGDVDAEIETRGFYDADYKAAYKRADVELKKTLTPTKVEFADHPEIIEAVMSNPRPIKDDLLGRPESICISKSSTSGLPSQNQRRTGKSTLWVCFLHGRCPYLRKTDSCVKPSKATS